MAVPKPMRTEFGIHHRLESCVPVVFGLVVNFGHLKKLSLNFPLMSLTGNLKQMTDRDWSRVFREIKDIRESYGCLCLRQFLVKRFAFKAKTGPLKQVLAAMGINHTIMNPGWDTAHQRTHESPSVHERDPLVWGIALFRFINCVIINEDCFIYID